MTQAVRKDRVGTNLTEGPIMSSLLLFAIPIVLTNLVQQLYSMVDLIVIGQYVGNIGTVGVNTGGEMADLVTPVAMGFSTAGQIYIAQLFGAKADRKIKQTVGTLLSFMMMISVALVFVAFFFHRTILELLNCPPEAMSQAANYMIITALGYPFIFGYNAVCGILRGMGESKRPLYFILVAATVNIVLDILLVVVFHLEAAGTAIATTASQMGAFIAAFLFMWKKRERFDFELKLSYLKLDREILWILVRLGIPQVVRSMFVRFGMLWVNSSANAYGLVVSATNSVGNKLQKFLEVFIQGIDTASASMIGQNLGGAQDRTRGQDHDLHGDGRHGLRRLLRLPVHFLPPSDFRDLYQRRGGDRPWGHVFENLYPALFRLLGDRVLPGHGNRLRVCGAGIFPGSAGRRDL